MSDNFHGITFAYSDDSCKEVVAEYTSQDEATPMTASGIRSLASEKHDFGTLNFDNELLEKFVSDINENLSARAVIATTTPVDFTPYVSEDWQRVIAVIHKRDNIQVTNTKIPKEQLKVYLHKNKIISGIFEKLPIPVEKKSDYFIPVAKANLPSPPPETYQLLFHQPDKPINIPTNSKLMQYMKGISNDTGEDVFGNELSQEHLNQSPFNNTLNGSKESAHDPNLLISTTSGHPVVHIDGVAITEVRTIKQVTLLHSPCTYEGTLYVKEDIESGVEIDVDGDVIIDGMVGAASIKAKGNIIVKSGVMGGVVKDGEESTKKGATLIADGIIKAKYIDNANVTANNHLLVAEYISNCDVICHKKVLVGSKNGKGQVIGGDMHTSLGLVANIIGTNANIETKISIGMPKDVSIEMIENEAELYELDYQNYVLKREIGINRKNLDTETDDTKKNVLQDKIHELDVSYKENITKIQRIKHVNQNLRREQIDYEKATIFAKNQIFNNCIIKFRESEIMIDSDQNGARFKIIENEIKQFNT